MDSKKPKIISFFELLEKAACLIILFLVLITVVNVIARRVFSMPIFGVTEIVEYGTLAAICLAAGSATLNRVHPAVSIVTSKLKPKAAIAVLLVTDAVSLLVLVYVGVNLAPNVFSPESASRLSDSLGIPYSVIYGLIVLCIFVVAGSYILLSIRDIRNLAKPAQGQFEAARKQRDSITPIAKVHKPGATFHSKSANKGTKEVK